MASWTLKYRPKTVSELHHQRVREQLLGFMKAGKIPQVLLFAGPKGIGKTSASRIIAALLNDPRNTKAVQLAYLENTTKRIELLEPEYTSKWLSQIIAGRAFCVQELDAASNRGINEIRAIKERIELPPVEGSMAVYILDEAHMLTTPAFNALLKVMEEPPPHVIFILATTQIQKIPDTIISRCQVLRFTKATGEELTQALLNIAKQEKLKVNTEVIAKIAELADGSFRDAVKLLEQLSLKDSDKNQYSALDLFPPIEEEVVEMLKQIVAKEPVAVSAIFTKWRALNIDESYLLGIIVKKLHQDLMLSYEAEAKSTQFTRPIALFLLKAFNITIEQDAGPLPLLTTELVALEIIEKAQKKTAAPPKSGNGQSNLQTRTTKPDIGISTNNHQAESLLNQTPGNCQKLMDNWDEFMAAVSSANTRLATLFCSIKPIVADGNRLTLGVDYQFHLEQLTQPKALSVIEQIAGKLSGGKVEFEFHLSKLQPAVALDFNTALIS